MKKVELHIHLDGSLRIETIVELGIKANLIPIDSTIEKIQKSVSTTVNDKTLVDYLKKFDLPIKLMQKEESLTRVTFELIEDLAKEDTIYTEIRVAPIQHTKMGLNPNQIVEAILKGLKLGEEKYNIKANLLLCAMRHLPEIDNMFLIDLVKKYRSIGVVGLDLAGDEAGYPVTLFNNFFEKAKKNSIPFTIHAGEAQGAKSVIDAINLGATRIGHGIRSGEDQNVLQLIKEKDICLECCPKSNIDTNVFTDFKDYPLYDFLQKGISVTLSSDNRTVSNTDVDNEITLLNKYFNLTDQNIIDMNINALNHAFISQEQRDNLKDILTGETTWN